MTLSKATKLSILCVFFSIALFACDTSSPPQSTDDSKAPIASGPAAEAPASNTTTQAVERAKYIVLENPIPVSTGDKIEVVELFWYGCSHCFALEPFVKSWLETKSDNSEFVKIPAVFSAGWAFHAQAFYTMEALGVLEQSNDAFFHQVHVVRKPISNLESLIEFLAQYGKDEEEVTSAYSSFAVDTKLRNATNMTKQSTATGVPAILIDGKYLTSVSQAGGQAELFSVIDELVDKAASER